MKRVSCATLLIFGFGALIAPRCRAAAVSQDIKVEETRNQAEAGKHCLFVKDANGRPSPGVVIKKDRIEVLDDKGNPTNTVPLENVPAEAIETHVYADPHGKVVGIQVTKGIDERREAWKTGEYYILDASGRKTLDLKPFNDATHPLPSPSGDYAVGWTNEMGPPIFYDAQGTRNAWARKWYERAKKGFRGEPVAEWPDMFEASKAWFSRDGSRVAVHGTGPGPRASLVVYDASGNKLFEKDDAWNPVFSRDEARMAYAVVGKKIAVVDASGAAVWEKSGIGLPEKFSEDGKLLLVQGREKLTMLDAATGKVIWDWQPTPGKLAELRHGATPPEQGPLKGNQGFGFTLVAGTPDFSRVVALGSTLKEEPVWPGKPQRRIAVEKDHLLVFDGKGNLLAWEELPGDTFSVPTSEISISVSDDGKTIAVPGPGGMHYFSVK